MREKPISIEIEEATDLKVLLKLSDEIKELFLKLMSTDRRTLRQEEAKSHFQGRLQLYSTLYKKCREKFIRVKKQTKESSSYFKDPILFEDLIKDFNWERTVKYSRPETKKETEEKLIVIVDDEDDEDDEDKILKTIKPVSVSVQIEDDNETITFSERRKILTEEFTKIFNNKMKKLFNRTDPTVIADALTQTIVEFVEKYDEITTKEVLERVYREIQSQNSTKSTNEKIQDRVGGEKITEPLEAIIPTTGDSVVLIPVGKKVKFSYHDGVDKKGVVITSTEKSLIVQSEKSIKYPIRPDMILEIYEEEVVEEKVVQSLPEEQVQEMLQEEHQNLVQEIVEEEIVETTTIQTVETIKETIESSTEFKEVVVEQNVERTSKPFKEFEKEKQQEVVQSYYDCGKTKCGEIKKQMIADGYIISHYDDVYYPFMKIKK